MSNKQVAQFCEKLAGTTAEVLKQLTAKEFSVETDVGEGPKSCAHAVTVRRKAHPEKQVVVRYGPEVLKLFVHALLGDGVMDESSGEAREIELEAWRQVIGRANTELREELKGDELEVTEASGGGDAVETTVVFRLKAEGDYVFQVGFSPSFFVESELLSQAVVQEQRMVSADSCDHKNLDLLLEIPLAVTLRFGERRMPLRNILDLSSGAVLELDRQADDPVDLCLDDRVIARGHVVVVDGCYGLRVTQICRPVDYGLSSGARA